MKKNILNVDITRPDQKLILTRGIPASGKSTLSKKLVGNGIIHSTDNVIESMGDYREFFANMMKSGDFSPLSRAHDTNYKNVVKSILNNVSPIIVDNTHIKANEAKRVVVKALEMGFSEDNIEILDIGTNGLTAQELFERGTHGVPLEKLESMIKAYKSVGPLTIQKILDSKDMFPKSDVLYSAVVLDQESIVKLLSPSFLIENNSLIDVENGWIIENGKYFSDHMTICLGPLEDKSDLGKEVTLRVTHIGSSDMAMAVKVEGYPSKNENPHVTIAINSNGGAPKMSNQITKWKEIKEFEVKGIVTEIKRK